MMFNLASEQISINVIRIQYFLCFLLLRSKNLANFSRFRKYICHCIKDSMGQKESKYQNIKHDFMLHQLNLAIPDFKLIQ